MKLKYNAPIILTFAFVSSAIMLIAQIVGMNFMYSFFTVPGNSPGFNFISLDVFKLITHVAGHADWGHLLGNFTFILLIGPILEEKYGSTDILFMMIVTALVTGIINVIFFPHGLLGASGIVFMLILLISFTNIKQGELPITFILIVALFLVKEIIGMFEKNDISEMAHILGGLCGSVFCFIIHKNGNSKIDNTSTA